MSQYFPNLSTHFGGKVELDLSNYTIKYEVEKAAGTDASTFAKKSWFNPSNILWISYILINQKLLHLVW